MVIVDSGLSLERRPSTGRGRIGDAGSAARPKRPVILAGSLRRHCHAVKFWTRSGSASLEARGRGSHQVGSGQVWDHARPGRVGDVR